MEGFARDRITAILRECDADDIALQELDAGRLRSKFIKEKSIYGEVASRFDSLPRDSTRCRSRLEFYGRNFFADFRFSVSTLTRATLSDILRFETGHAVSAVYYIWNTPRSFIIE